MPIYNYTGLNGKGKQVSGYIESGNQSFAVTELKSKGIYVTVITLDPNVSGRINAGTDRRFKAAQFKNAGFYEHLKNISNLKIEKRPSQSDIAVLFHQIYSLLKAGVPVYESILDIKPSVKNKMLSKILSDISGKIKEGLPFSSSLKEYPDVFPNIVTSSVEAGEESGSLVNVLENLVLYLDEKTALRKKILGALVYPIVMSSVGFLILSYIVIYIVPVIAKVFKQVHSVLPLPTRIILSVSFVFSHYIILITVFAIAVYLYLRWYFKTKEGKTRLDKVLLKTPLIGKYILLKEINLYSQNLSLLLSSGVIITRAMDTALLNISNSVLKDALSEAKKSMEEGEGLYKPLSRYEFFPPIFLSMIKTGEKSGNIENMLTVASKVIKSQLDFYISSLTQLLEPMLVVVMGLMVGFIVISIMLPIFEMSSLIKK
ncbi:MAG: type II secretion system F family protein [bacterium]